MKQIVFGVLILAAVMLAWRMFDKNGRAKRSMENVVDDVALTMEEKSLPDGGDASYNAVIRRAMLEQREKDNREWTAANINAHPDLYLAHCGKMLGQFLGQYENSMLEVKILIKQQELESADAKEEIASLMTCLKEAKKVLSGKAHAYPVKIGTYTYANVENVESLVRSADKRLTDLEKISANRSRQVEQLQNTLNELTKGRDVVRRELDGIARKREQAKVRNMQKAVEGLQTRMNAVLGGISVVSEDDEPYSGIADTTKDKEKIEDIFTKRGIK